MKLRKHLALLMAALLIVTLFAGCSSTAATDNMVGGSYGELKEETSTAESIAGNGGSSAVALPENQKLIRTIRIEAETEDLDGLLATVNQRITELEGYVEAQNIYNGSAYNTRRSRNANLTIRIPAEQLDAFVGHVSQDSNITSKNESTENITLSYVATQSRITALETEQTRLLELLAKAEDMEDLLLIESRLTEVRTELEQVTSQLRLYDNQVNYGTIHLNIYEVREYTPVEEPETVWERIAEGFMENLKGLGDGLTELFIFVVTGLPYLIPLGAVVTLVILSIKKKRKKAAQVPPEKKAE